MADAPATDTPVVDTVVKPRRTARTIAIAVTVTILSAAAVLAALWAVDGWARQQIVDQVTVKARQVLNLEATAPVQVEVAGFSVIAQVLGGSLDEVSVNVDDVSIGDLTGDVSLTATGVPMDLTKPVKAVDVDFRVSEDDLQSVALSLSNNAVDAVELVGSEVRFGTEFRIFGFRLTVGVGVEPFAKDGEIGFTPTSVELNGSRTSVDDLVDSFDGAAEALLQTRTFCVASQLPAVLTLNDVVVDNKELVVTIGARNAVFDADSVSTLGTCPTG